jgi:hypothetical protein
MKSSKEGRGRRIKRIKIKSGKKKPVENKEKDHRK